jgi:transposase
MWLARGGPPDKPVIVYEYHPTRGALHAKGFLEDFSGYVQTDGYEGYDAAIDGRTDIIHAGCFAHARRKFFEASKISKKPGSAEEGMSHIRRLYRLESGLRARKLEEAAFFEERKKAAEPILAAFKSRLEKRAGEVPPSLLLGKALHYTINQWDKLVAYLGSPHLTPDNNGCENAIRPFVLGRKNWLFNKSPEGAESSCGMYSLIETARQNGLEPREYLRTLFERCPLAKTSQDWEKLLPWNIFTA